MSLSIQLILIAIGGAIGACVRFVTSSWVNASVASSLPLGTVVVNAMGSCLMAIAYVLVTEKGLLPESLRPFFMVGVLGALTTFSSFSLEAVTLFEQGLVLHSVVYTVANIVLSLVFFVIGLTAVRLIV